MLKGQRARPIVNMSVRFIIGQIKVISLCHSPITPAFLIYVKYYFTVLLCPLMQYILFSCVPSLWKVGGGVHKIDIYVLYSCPQGNNHIRRLWFSLYLDNCLPFREELS